MIKNIIFDVGNVLVDFRYHDYMLQLGFSDDAVKVIEKKLIGNDALWSQLDYGREPEEETIRKMIGEVPGYEKYVDTFFSNIIDIVETYPYTVSWIKELKSKGYGVYILSNYPPKWWTLHDKERFGFTHLVDGMVVSGFVNTVKPEKEIYECLLKKYDLNPDECLFFDDRKKNIDGAKAAGIHGYVFTTYEDAVEYLKSIGI